MALIFLDAYEPTALTAVINAMNTNILVIKLYKNNYAPVDGSVFGSFVECDFSGYTQQTMFMTLVGEVANKAVAIDGMPRSFTHNGGGTTNTVYGYWIVDATTGVVPWAEKFPAPINMASNGDSITIQAQLTLDSANH